MKQRVLLIHLLTLLFSVAAFADGPSGHYDNRKESFLKRSFTQFKLAQKRAVMLESPELAETFFMAPPPPAQIVFSKRVNSSNDDAEERVSNGSMSRGSSDLELGHDGGNEQIVGMRFRGINVPSGVAITNAYIEFTVDETDYSSSSFTIYGQDVDDASSFSSSSYNISNRTKTSASVPWNSVSNWTTVGNTHQTPDLSSIVQEIIDRGGWSSGNDMVFMIDGTGERTAESYNGSSGSAPLLVIEYDDGIGSESDFWLEAECGTVGSGLTTNSDGNASNGEFVVWNNGDQYGTPSNNTEYIRFSIDVVTAGNYKVFARTIAPDTGSDSWWVRANGGSWVKYNSISQSNNWEWHQVHDADNSNALVTFPLAAGANTIDFGRRENCDLDKIFVTLNGGSPAGAGDVAQNCSGGSDYNIGLVDGQTINTCAGNFFDSGGPGGNHQDNEDYTVTFCSDNGENMQADFTAFNVETHASCGYDFLRIYDGPNSSAPSIGGKYCGTNSPGTVTASGTCLHFVWHSDGGFVTDGWEATLSCVAGGGGGGGDYIVDAVDGQTINTCTGNFFDTGGSAASYSNNEDYSVTFCSDNSDQIQFDFSAFNVENHATCGYDYLTIYNGVNSSAPQIGKYCGTNSPGTVASTTGCLHFVWHADGGAIDAGWEAAISCVAGGGGGGGSCSGIINPGFEIGKIGWSDGGGVSTTNDAFAGSSAIELKNDGTWLSQSVPVSGGQTYYLTFAAKAVDNPNWAEVYMVWKDASWNDIRSAIQPIKNSQFQTYEMIDKAPANAAYITIGGYKEGYVTKSLIIDDFCLATGPALGGSNYDMACGCEDNMLPNPGIEIHDPSMSFNYSIGGNPVAHLGSSANNNALPPWTTGLSSPYMFYVDDTQDAVNNPEGDYFVILPGNGDCWLSNLNFGNELDMVDGEQYIFCFYAASFDVPTNGSGLPTGSSSGGEESGIILLEFDYVNSGVHTVESWQTPSSSSWTNLSWKKYSYTFTYSSADPIEDFYFTNARDNTGTAIDAVTLSRLDCSDTQGNDCPTGSIDFEKWTGVSGNTVGDLITQQDYPNIPDISGRLTSFQGQANSGDSYGTRVRGYLHPTETGNYQFNVTGDDEVWLYLSSDTNFVNKTKIATVPGYTSWNDHTKYPEQTSANIALTAGEKYYIELLHKEGGGGDHFQAFWKTPSNSSWTIIDGAYLSGYACGNDGYDCMDAIIVTGQTSEEVYRYNPVTGNFNNDLVTSGLSAPEEMVLGPDGNLYVSNYNSNRIKVYDPYTGAYLSTFASSNMNHPTGLTFGPDGNLYVANYSSNNVVKFNGSTGAYMGVFASGNGLSNPGIGLEFGPDGNLYVGNRYQKVLRFDGSTGAFIDEFITLSNSSQRIGDIVFDRNCNWYVSNFVGNSIEKFTSNGNPLGRFDNGGSLNSPRGMVFGPDNNLYVADKSDNKVYRYNGDSGNFMDVFVNSGNGLSGANGALFLPKLGCNCEYLLNGGTIGGDVNTCVPLDVPALTSGSAFNGSVQYQWAMSIDDGETWTDIAGADNETYDPGIVSQNTLFVRRAQVVGCSRFFFSNTVAVTFGICEICYDGIDNDGDGLIDCEDGDCISLVVTTTADNVDGDVSSIVALTNNPGADGHISLREAITASQTATGRTSYHIIGFDIPNNDPRHFYYQNDNTAGQVSRANMNVTSAANDGAIGDIDPDHPYSFWSIQTSSALPAMRDNVMIDGYCVAGAEMNSEAFGNDLSTVLKIEVTGAHAGAVLNVDEAQMPAPIDSLNAVVVRGISLHNSGSGQTALKISGNGTSGRSWFYGNFIGVDPSGLLEMSSASDVVQVEGVDRKMVIGSDGSGGNAAAEINLLSGSTGYNGVVDLQSATTLAEIRGNYFGIGKDGVKNIGGGDGTAITATDGQGNVIEGNVFGFANTGIALTGADGYSITGNFIGTDTGESHDFGFATDGGNCQGCTGLQFENNVVANNVNIGFAISETQGAELVNNRIYSNGGVGFSAVDFSNTAAQSDNVLISGNTIFDNNTGVQVGKDADHISIVGNSIYENTLLGIDHTTNWSANGPETNDSDDSDGGANRRLNYPQLAFESLLGNNLNLRYSIDVQNGEAAALDGYRLEFFANNTEDPSGHGEGEIFIGSINITSDKSNELLALTIPPNSGGPDYYVSATATEIEDISLVATDEKGAYGATSEFSNTIYAEIKEICDNGLDDDGDGLIDCLDDDCSPEVVAVPTEENCSGGGGGAIDLTVTGEHSPFTFLWSDMVETAQLTFEDNTNDESGNGHSQNGGHGTISYSSDAIQGNKSASFDGATYLRYSVDGSYMEIQFQRLAVAMWIKPTGLTGNQTLFDEGGGTNGIAMRLNGSTLEAAVRNGNTQFNAGTHTFPNDGQWHHVAMVYDNGDLTLYLDGVAGSTTTASYTTVNNHSGNGGFGYYDNGSGFGGGTGRYFTGLMDDIRYYYQSVISPDYVADLARNDGDRTNLVAGNYDVTVTSTTGCTATATAYIESGSNYTDAGTIGSDEDGCGNFTPAKIVDVVAPSGGSSGTPEYKWEMSTDGGATWSAIASSNAITYTPPQITQTTHYRRAARLLPCTDWLYSNVVVKTVMNNFTDAGTIAGDEDNCGSLDPSIISSVSAASGGNGGTPEYQWERSADGSTWVNISGATSLTYDPGTISQTYHFRRAARLAPCADWLYSNVVVKTVIDNFTSPGSIMGEEENCGSFDPNIISSIDPPTGGVGGTLVYQWERSDNAGLTWSIIAGAVSQAYDPGTITKTTIYRRGARRAPCTSFVYSNEITKLVAINYTNAGAISGEESVCGPFNPGVISSLSGANGGEGGFPEYQWEKSTDNAASWQEIAGANATTYNPPFIGSTTLYRRKARRLPCSIWVNSNMIIKTVKAVPFASVSDAPSGYLCENTAYTFAAQDVGDGSSFSWDFGPYATPASANGPGPHVVVYDVPNAAESTTVVAEVTVDLDGCVQTDNVSLEVRPEIIITNVATTDLTNCAIVDGEIAISATFPAGADVEASIDGGATWGPNLGFTNLAAGSYDIKVRYEGEDCVTDYGTVTLSEPIIGDAEMVVSSLEECEGETFTFQAFITLGSPNLTWDFGVDATPATATGKGPHYVEYGSGGVKNVTLIAEETGCEVPKDTAITVVANYTAGGTIIGDEGLCSTSDPSIIIAGASPEGGVGGTPEYEWEYREGDGAGNWGYWTAIAGTNAPVYDPASISTITEYRRKTRLSPCYDWVYSNVVSKIFSSAPVAFDDSYDTACPGFYFVDNVSSNDENLQNTSYTVIVPPPNGVVDIDADGEFVYTPNSTFCGSDQFTYQVCNDGSSCCDTATVVVDLSDHEIPSLDNIPADITINCDDELPLPPLVEAVENCQSVSLGFDVASTQGADSCAINSYVLTRIWTAVDYCGNYVSDEQDVTIVDQTNPDIFRIYELPNGTRIVAGVMENVTDLWKTIRMPIQFIEPPVVLTQVVSQNDNSAVVPRLRNVATTQFQLRLQEEEDNDGTHPAESVAWIAIEKGAFSQGLNFEAYDLLVSSENTTLNFNTNFAAAPSLFTSMMTYNENEPAGIRTDNLNSGTVDMFVEEETSADPELSHGYETVGYLAIEGQGNIENIAGEVFGETGVITVTHNTINIPLENEYHNPVVVIGSLSNNDDSPATIRVKNVTATDFDIYVEEWDYLNGTHAPETVAYMVVEGSIPLDATVDCHDLPEALQINSELIAVDNCDNTVVISFEESENLFDCEGHTEFTRTWSTRDECGNVTSLTQTFFLLDTIPPTFTVPGKVIMYCTNDKDDLTVTGDVYDETDNCATGLEAVYTDDLANLDACSGYITRIWTLTDLCGNSTVKEQLITVINGNDTDNDGVPDDIDHDDDNDGIPDVIETHADTDGDGITNDRDLDSDNDGISDIIEAGFVDRNGDGVVDRVYQIDWDNDFDGYANTFDHVDTDSSLSASVVFDTTYLDPDGDGIMNFHDLDSDNDGIPDCIEVRGLDTDGDGVLDYPVDGVATSMDDEDGDGFSSYYDPDEDGVFGIDDPSEPLIYFDGAEYYSGDPSSNPDFDDDGVPDFLDLDSDNDGIPDLIEMGGVDENGDGRIDSGSEYVDLNHNGFHDDFETDPMVTTEGDGMVVDGRPEDSNADGSTFVVGDFDSDNSPAYRDLDSDGDGINDIAEMRNIGYDLNGDGKIDAITDGNGDGFEDGFANSGVFMTDGDGFTNDGRPEDNSADADDSPYGSTLADGTFGETNGQPDCDDDGDGELNSLDLDSDGDLIRDGLEDVNRNGNQDPGETNPLDVDSDDDQLLDGVEDSDQNGFYDTGETNPLNEDTDGDFFNDGQEDANFNGLVDNGESDPRDPCDPVLSGNCVGVNLMVKAKLQGALLGNGIGSNLMRDDLREKEYLPNLEPYSELDLYKHASDGGGETAPNSAFQETGVNAPVDWVLIELRHFLHPDSIVATKAAIIQRDGDVVNPDGDPVLHFGLVKSGDYFVGLRHRNHLGVLTEDLYLLSPDPVLVDFSDPDVPMKGGYSRVEINGEMALWSGDMNGDRDVIYQGPFNDGLSLFMEIVFNEGNSQTLANFIAEGYKGTDIDMDGRSIYQGPDNERTKLLFDAVLKSEENVSGLANFVLGDDLPELNSPSFAPSCQEDSTIPSCDFDGDGTINELDLDDDDDGVKDINDVDPYNPNSDSDADGISDVVETGGDGRYHPGEDTHPLEQDTDNDGLEDGEEDTNKNGVVDPGETDPSDPCDPVGFSPLCDFDDDGLINTFDLDDDNDGVPDVHDANQFDPYSDSDEDGITDAEETGYDGAYNIDEDSDPLNACDPDTYAGNCASIDEDQDGYFPNYPVDHPNFDPNDSNSCIPFSATCPCADDDGDGKIEVCLEWLNQPKTIKVSLWLWPFLQNWGASCGPCGN